MATSKANSKSKSKSKKSFLATDMDPAKGKEIRKRGEEPASYKTPFGLVRRAATTPRAKYAVKVLARHAWRKSPEEPGPLHSNHVDPPAGVQDLFRVGEPIGPSMAACMVVLEEEGVDSLLLDALWEIYTGPAA